LKTRIYLDTSVLSALLDERMPDRQALTREFWERRYQFELTGSDLVRSELARVSDPVRREQLIKLLDELTIQSITLEMQELAKNYIALSCFSPAMFNDALHVAAAVLSRQDILISWNFKHLVNRARRAKVAVINLELGLPALEILAPPEV